MIRCTVPFNSAALKLREFYIGPATCCHLMILDGISQESLFPAQLRPAFTDATAYIVCTGVGMLINRAVLKVVESTNTVRSWSLVRQRVPKHRRFFAQCRPARPYRAVYVKSANVGMPINRAAGKILMVPRAINIRDIARDARAQKARTASKGIVLVINCGHTILR